MKPKITLLSILLSFVLVFESTAQTKFISKEEAFEKVKAQFEGMDVDYYILEDASSSNWEFFVDADPMAGWEHDSYTLGVPKQIGSMFGSVIPVKKLHRIPPEGNYVPYLIKDRYGLEANQKPVVRKVSNITNQAKEAANRTYAIILSGGVDKKSNHERYWNDCSFIFQTLVNKYGVPKEQIYPVMSDGTNPAMDMLTTTGRYVSQPLDLDKDGEADIKFSATKSNVKSILNTISGQINSGDHLFLYVIDHGGTANGHSYIWLWNNEKLYDYELRNLLQPFSDKKVNINVVLGQCYSGGFIDDLSDICCVVATASNANEPSWACKSIPYDEFVHRWTSAINCATSLGVELPVDQNADWLVTMDEAFQYAKKNDSRPEHPQYSSNPISIGEDLAFNRLPSPVDLYIKDNPEDTGKEPNKTTDEFWKSPSIWVRNNNDSIEVHQNPEYSPEHLMSYIYVRIHNRGIENYTGGKFLHMYWALASTGIYDRTWKGRELYNGTHVTGDHLEAKHILPIEAGKDIVMRVNWPLPSLLEDYPSGTFHFCLMAKIMDTSYDDGYVDGKVYFNLRGSNDQAQKNVNIISKNDLFKEHNLYVRNVSSEPQSYTLELIPRTQEDEAIFTDGNIDMSMSSPIFSAWERGGCKSQDVILLSTNTSVSNLKKVRFLKPNSKLQCLSLKENEFDLVKFKFSFNQISSESKTYTLDLVQKDENGNIIGGETFIVESPSFNLTPLEIETASVDGDSFELQIVGDEYTKYEWLNGDEEIIGNSESLLVRPRQGNDKFKVVATNCDGDFSVGAISLEHYFGFKEIIKDNEYLLINMHLDVPHDAKLTFVSLLDGEVKKSVPLTEGSKHVVVDVKNLEKNMYVVVYSVKDEIIDREKVTL